MEENEFKPGDIVRFKTLEMFQKEGYAINFDGMYTFINVDYGVNENMLNTYKDQDLIVAETLDDRIYFEADPAYNLWTVSKRMVYKVDKSQASNQLPKCYDLRASNFDTLLEGNEVKIKVKYQNKILLNRALINLVCLLDAYDLYDIDVLFTRDMDYNSKGNKKINIRFIIKSLPKIKEDIAKLSEVQQEDYGYFVQNAEWITCFIDENSYSDVVFAGVAKTLIAAVDFHIPEEMSKAILNIDVTAILVQHKIAMEIYKTKKTEKEFQKIQAKIENAIVVNRRNHLECVIRDVKNDIDRYEQNLHESWSRLRKCQKELWCLERKDLSNILINFITILKDDRENIISIDTNDNSLYLTIKVPLTFFADEDWEIVKGGLYDSVDVKEEMKYLLDAIFKRKAVITFTTRIRMDFENNYVEHVTETCEEEGIPNPHMYFYQCWGDNYNLIERAMNEEDYVSAYLQVKSSLMGLTLTDIAVMRRFILDELENPMIEKKIKCITDVETGKMMTIREAKKYYRGKSYEKNNADCC